MSNFPLRINDDLKEMAKEKAKNEGISLNSLIEKSISNYVGFNSIDLKDDVFKVACCDSHVTKAVKSALIKAGITENHGDDIDDSSSFIFVKNGVMKAVSYSLFKKLECKELDWDYIVSK